MYSLLFFVLLATSIAQQIDGTQFLYTQSSTTGTCSPAPSPFSVCVWQYDVNVYYDTLCGVDGSPSGIRNWYYWNGLAFVSRTGGWSFTLNADRTTISTATHVESSACSRTFVVTEQQATPATPHLQHGVFTQENLTFLSGACDNFWNFVPVVCLEGKRYNSYSLTDCRGTNFGGSYWAGTEGFVGYSIQYDASNVPTSVSGFYQTCEWSMDLVPVSSSKAPAFFPRVGTYKVNNILVGPSGVIPAQPCNSYPLWDPTPFVCVSKIGPNTWQTSDCSSEVWNTFGFNGVSYSGRNNAGEPFTVNFATGGSITNFAGVFQNSRCNSTTSLTIDEDLDADAIKQGRYLQSAVNPEAECATDIPRFVCITMDDDLFVTNCEGSIYQIFSWGGKFWQTWVHDAAYWYVTPGTETDVWILHKVVGGCDFRISIALDTKEPPYLLPGIYTPVTSSITSEMGSCTPSSVPTLSIFPKTNSKYSVMDDSTGELLMSLEWDGTLWVGASKDAISYTIRFSSASSVISSLIGYAGSRCFFRVPLVFESAQPVSPVYGQFVGYMSLNDEIACANVEIPTQDICVYPNGPSEINIYNCSTGEFWDQASWTGNTWMSQKNSYTLNEAGVLIQFSGVSGTCEYAVQTTIVEICSATLATVHLGLVLVAILCLSNYQ